MIYPCGITLRHEYDYPAPLEYLPSSDCLSQENIDYYFNYLKRNKIDVVINQSGNFSDSALWCKAREIGVKVVSVLHSTPMIAYEHLWHTDIWPLKNDLFVEKFKRIARCILYPRLKRQYLESRKRHFSQIVPATDFLVGLSENYKMVFEKYGIDTAGKYRVIPNANSYKSAMSPCGKEKEILFVALFGGPKREELALKIWSKVYCKFPDWKFVIVGTGSKMRVNRVKKAASQYERLEYVGQQDAYLYQKRAAIAVLTSAYEGWPMVLTEAMQCGAVPIAFNSFGAVTDIIADGENGYLIKPFKINDYVAKLTRLMADDELRNRLAQNAIRDVARFNVENIVDCWEKLFEML